MIKQFFFIQLIILTFINFGCKTKTLNNAQLPKPNIVWITSEDNSKHYMKLFDAHGIETPNIKELADNGLIFTHAFSNTPVCSAARSTLISGCYGPRLASHYHRKIKQVPMPDGLEMFPVYLRRAGYYTTNNHKEDYNIIKSDSTWDDSSKKASWKNRQPKQPFFHVYNIHTTHESSLHFTKEDIKKATTTNQETVFVQPNHPQTNLFKYSVARYHDKIQKMDEEAGTVINELKKEGLLDNTFIFYFGDHGGILPGSKGYINETGVHVPLIVYIPPKYKHLIHAQPRSKIDGFVSFIDFGATVLNLAGINIPEKMDGKPFLGKGITAEILDERDETFSYADRFDEKYDMVRAIRKGKYKYIRHYQPFNFDGLMNNYRYKQLGYQEWKMLFEAKKLNTIQSRFFQPKPPEALYNVENDPFETKNLANLPEYKAILKTLRAKLSDKVLNMPDLSFYPEFYLINNACDNPVKFGQDHKKNIKKYVEISNLSLNTFEDVKDQIETSLNSTDPLERYWALIVCSSFGKLAKKLVPIVKTIAYNDSELINKVRAAEFLGITKALNPVKIITDALYNSKDNTEALLIMNSIVLLQDGETNYKFNIKKSKLHENVNKQKFIAWRLEYLNKE